MTEQDALHEASIRSFRDGDAPAIRVLHGRTPPAGSPPSLTPQPWPLDLADIPRHFSTSWVAEIEGEIVGMVRQFSNCVCSVVRAM